MEKALRIKIKGIVQGVGFRPFVYRIARENNIKGFVRNEGGMVVIEAEGSNMDSFLNALKERKPPMAEIMDIRVDEIEHRRFKDFVIESSESSDEGRFVSPDIATCDDCLRELFDPEDRRYLYPFINCTNCGPRFTIIESLPYDRERTTMKKFKMCEACENEYRDPASRRFHAQPDCCAACGPEVELLSNEKEIAKGNEAMNLSAELLLEGRIVAIKGLGGFHLACDATDERAVEELRVRKGRESKPFALMAPLKLIKNLCEVSSEEEKLLLSPRRPIVLLRRKPDDRTTESIASSVAPSNKYLGFMLPYTPIHLILFSLLNKPLVMTSANISESPIIHKNEEILSSKLADFYLIHNREIHTRCDDSVAFIQNGEMVTRRARGYAPEPIEARVSEGVLACGAHTKNTFAITLKGRVIMSQHIGDLEESYPFYEEEIEHFKSIFSFKPALIAHDLHPEYLSTKYAAAQEGKKTGIQHHHAHICSCMAENCIDEALGIAFDGAGYGNDGNIWGGEFMVCDFEGFERITHLEYVPMPGGAKAIEEPWRMKLAYLSRIGALSFASGEEREKWRILSKFLDRYPLTSSAGRLFDAVSALLGIKEVSRYEGEAAIALEMIADENEKGAYDTDIKGDTISFLPMIEEIVNSSEKKEKIAGKFHNTIANVILEVCVNEGIKDIALSGGVFQNRLLLKKTFDLLTANGFRVHMHHRIPTNDGCISFGQACIAGRRR
ncbi:MAG: carbamoyltransferase HypF [Candidatus Thermoplasmatota archaeon]|nr:carbamoyltransferase HypF [Candidatus Thermoplasmatota archaeon]